MRNVSAGKCSSRGKGKVMVEVVGLEECRAIFDRISELGRIYRMRATERLLFG
jgi:hypothetical protein